MAREQTEKRTETAVKPEAASVEQEATAGRRTSAPSAELIPGWLALTVLVLLLGVAALGGYLLRGALTRDEPVTPEEYAIEDWESAVASEPDNPENLLALGYSYQQDGRLEEALELYDEVLVLDADNSGAMYNKGIVLMELGRTKDAEAVLWDLLEMAPDHVLAAKALGQYYVDKKHYKSALVALEPVLKVRPEYADLQYLAGYSCEQLGLREPAITYYRGALTYNPGHSGATEGLARLGEAQ